MAKIDVQSMRSYEAYCILCGNFKSWCMFGEDTYPSERAARRRAAEIRRAYKYKTMVVPCNVDIKVNFEGNLEDKVWNEMRTRYVVRLNDLYMTEYNEKNGYNTFGEKKKAFLFLDIDDATEALVDVVWGGTDSPPVVEKIKVEAWK